MSNQDHVHSVNDKLAITVTDERAMRHRLQHFHNQTAIERHPRVLVHDQFPHLVFQVFAPAWLLALPIKSLRTPRRRQQPCQDWRLGKGTLSG